jgi:hypothetical protein
MEEQVRPSKLVPAAGITDTFPAEAFHPLMHSLLTFGLVRRVEDADGSHHWQLAEAAEKRLDQLSEPLDRSTAKLAYLDHWCASCRQQRLTHLCDGRYLCPDCERTESEHETVETNVKLPHRWERPMRPRRSG